MSPFATRDNRIFKCGDRELLRIGFLMINTQHFFQILTQVATSKLFVNYVKCCDRGNVVGHHCTSVEKLWTKQKDYFGLEGQKKIS